MHQNRTFLLIILNLILASLWTACLAQPAGEDTSRQNAIETLEARATLQTVVTTPQPSITTLITITYAPEEEAYVPFAIEKFNEKYRTQPDLSIVVEGRNASSGIVAAEIIKAIERETCDDIPTIFSPSVSHWLSLVNYRTNTEIFDIAASPGTARAPVVMAIWESRLRAIQEKTGRTEIGWEELLQVFESENGWGDYNIESERIEVYYGHTNPRESSTALSTLIAEFYAGAQKISDERLTELLPEHINNSEVQNQVREIENLIRHYAPRTTEFIQYIAQGPEYLDFVALEENDLIKINRGLAYFTPPEKLIALYPKEGTYYHDHPFAISNFTPDDGSPCVTEAQRRVAVEFTTFVRTDPEVQQQIEEGNFRLIDPGNKENTLPSKYAISEYGVDPLQPQTFLPVPSGEIISEVQVNWGGVRKVPEILIVIDTSESMKVDNKLEQAKEAVETFIQGVPEESYVGIISFDDSAEIRQELTFAEGGRSKLIETVKGLEAKGRTALYQAIGIAVDTLENSVDKRVKAIVLLSDGVDTSCANAENYEKCKQALEADILGQLDENRLTRNPIVIFPIAYAADDEDQFTKPLKQIGNIYGIELRYSDPDDIEKTLKDLVRFF